MPAVHQGHSLSACAESRWVKYVLALNTLLGNNNAATRLINNDFFLMEHSINWLFLLLKVQNRKAVLWVWEKIISPTIFEDTCSCLEQSLFTTRCLRPTSLLC